jgi:hypothetical protein
VGERHCSNAWIPATAEEPAGHAATVRLGDEPLELVQCVEPEMDEWQDRRLGVPDGFADRETYDDVVLAEIDDREGE